MAKRPSPTIATTRPDSNPARRFQIPIRPAQNLPEIRTRRKPRALKVATVLAPVAVAKKSNSVLCKSLKLALDFERKALRSFPVSNED